MSMYFTSDTHFGHANIIKYCNRPFRSVGEMDAKLIENWNAKVSPSDTVYHIGDFAMGHGSNVAKLLSRLNGTKILIPGNHDKKPSLSDGWEKIEPYMEIRNQGQMIVLCHYAMRVWNKSHHGSWMLYGHSHGTLPDDPNALSFDVGVDCHNYSPLSFDDVRHIMQRKKWKPVDHRGSR